MAEQILKKDPEWTAPLLWRSELRNVLAFYIRRNLLARANAQEIMDAATDMLRGREYEVASSRVLNLAANSPCSAYDCEFVAVAQELGVLLVTVDKQLLRQFPNLTICPRDFCASI